MNRSTLQVVGGFFLAALLSGSAWASVPPQPGTINYVEGQASIEKQALTDKSVGTARLVAGQSLSTQDGRAEILLTPGVFFRLGDHSSVQMVTSDLANTIMTLASGRAMVEVANILPENNVRVGEVGVNTRLLKPGLYDFDADHGQIRVFDGRAVVQVSGREVMVKGGHQLSLNAAGKLKARKFDKKDYASDFYRWASLRSAYLAEANVDAARTYGGGGGWSPSVWYGAGWYWDPSFAAYTFIPGDGIFYDPFGWGFYSPWMAFGAPYVYGYGGIGHGYGGFRRHFGPGYRPHAAMSGGTRGMFGHAYSVRGGSMTGFGARGFRGGGVVGMRGGSGFAGMRGGGGMHAGGYQHGGMTRTQSDRGFSSMGTGRIGGFGGGGHGGGGRR